MLAYLFLVLAIAVRFIPHPWTFTPVAAALLFFGARGSRRFLWVPLVAMAASDVVLTKLVYTYPFVWDHFVTWAWYAAILWLGTRLRDNAKPLPVIGAALAMPFFRSALAGDLLFTAAFFATPVALSALSEAFSKDDHAAAA